MPLLAVSCIYFPISRCCLFMRLCVRQEVVEATPCLFLVALDGDELKRVAGRAGGVAGVARLWLLVAWIPDDSKASFEHVVRLPSTLAPLALLLLLYRGLVAAARLPYNYQAFGLFFEPRF